MYVIVLQKIFVCLCVEKKITKLLPPFLTKSPIYTFLSQKIIILKYQCNLLFFTNIPLINVLIFTLLNYYATINKVFQ
jgi:hypothetical protein